MTRKRVKRLSLTIFLSVVAMIVMASPVYAVIAPPDATPTIISKKFYRHVKESNDMLAVIYANIPYGSTPSITANNAFNWRLVDTDNTTALGETTGYPYHASGYGYNVYALYFSATTAPPWNQLYILRLSGTPAAFTTIPTYDYPVNLTDYSSMTTTADSRAELTSDLLIIAADLDNKWGLTTATSLIASSEFGSVLSLYGEAFSRGAIYGVQGMAPSLFQTTIGTVDPPDRTWGDEYSTNLTSQWSDTWLENARNAGMTLFGTGYDLMGIMMFLALAFGILIVGIITSGDVWGSMADASIPVLFASKLAFFPLGILGILSVFAFIYIGLNLKNKGLFG